MLAVTIAAKVDENGTVILKVPPQVSPGLHKMVIVIEEAELAEWTNGTQNGESIEHDEGFVLPLGDVGPWPENLSLRREDLYDDWGR
jgi:hypothetical protein